MLIFCEIRLRIIHSSSANNSPSLPSSLEEDKPVTLLVASGGSYEDDQGEQQYLPDAIFAVISTMRIGQKVLILEKKEKDREEYRREGKKEGSA